MASLNSALLLVLLVAISAFMAAPCAEAQLLKDLIRVINMSGNVLCRVNETFPEGPAPPFPNASVDLRCRNNTVAQTRTNVFGRFNITVRAVDIYYNFKVPMLELIQRDCRVVVNTAIADCLENLTIAGSLVANLSPGVSTVLNGINVYDFVAGVFSLENI